MLLPPRLLESEGSWLKRVNRSVILSNLFNIPETTQMFPNESSVIEEISPGAIEPESAGS
jgi:hypothetical protein